MAAPYLPVAALVGATSSLSATRHRFIPDFPGPRPELSKPQPEQSKPKKSFPKSARVLRSSDFRTIYDTGERYTSKHFAAFYLSVDASAPGPRIGFTTPRALGRANVRNLVKRRFREAVRLHLDQLSPQWSVVINPRRSSLTLSFPALELEIQKLFRFLSSRGGSSESQPGPSADSSAYIK
jgi:ribonuclease P protein component